MNRLFLALLLAFAGLLTAPRSPAQSLGGASDLHFNGFVIYNEAGRLEKSGEIDQALTKYKEAASLYETIEKNYPTYEVETRMNRQRTIATAIARLEGNVSKNAAASQAAMELEKARITAQAQATAQANVQAMTPQAPLSGPVQDSSEIPSLDGLLRSWESKMRGKMLQLEADKKNLEIDLNKWGEWHDWAAGEMTRVSSENATLSKKAGALEQAILGMQNEVEAGRAAAGQLDALKQQKAAVEAEMAKNSRQLAAAEKAAADATAKLKITSESFAAVTQEKAKLDAEREKLVKERDEAVKGRDVAVKERDAASAKTLGLQADMDALKKKTANGDMKKLIAENERLQKELTATQKQVETLKADVTRKDEQITKLRGEVTTLQGQLTALRQESATYQTQVADLTRQMKELKEMPAGAPGTSEPNALITQENEMLRSIIMRQLRLQNRQQQAKDLIIAQLSKMENASTDLLKQVEELKNTRMTLSPEEEKLFKDPAAKELIGSNGVQATLIAASASPSATSSMPAPGSITTLLLRASEAYNNREFATAAKIYEDALRTEPKNMDALIGLGMTQQRAGKYAESEAALQKALAYDADNANASYAMAVTYFKQERWKDSMTFFEKSLDKSPQSASARHYLGIIATKLSLMERAEREFKTALAIDPNYGEAHFNLAVLYATWDPPQWDKARESYASALKKGVKPDQSLERLLEGGKKVSQN